MGSRRPEPAPNPNTYSLDTHGQRLRGPGLSRKRAGLSVMTTGPPALRVPQMLVNGKDPAFPSRSRVCRVTSAPCIFTKTQRVRMSKCLPYWLPQASVISAAPHPHPRAEPYRSSTHPDPYRPGLTPHPYRPWLTPPASLPSSLTGTTPRAYFRNSLVLWARMCPDPPFLRMGPYLEMGSRKRKLR